MDEKNEVRIAGRVSGSPILREVPSGDSLWTWRVVVPRQEASSRQSVDVLDCVAWTARARRSAAGWNDGDEVEIVGALRRRFFRGTGSVQSRTEVEMLRGRLVRRAVVSRNAPDD